MTSLKYTQMITIIFKFNFNLDDMVQRQMHITTRNSIARKLTVYNEIKNCKTLKADFYLKIFELH